MSTLTLQKPVSLGGIGSPRAVAIPAFAALALFSAFAFALRTVVSKASSVGLPLAPLLMLQSMMCVPLLMMMARAKKISLVPSADKAHLYVARVFWGGLTTLLLFYCLQKLPASLATALGYTAPLFTASLAPWLLKERSNRTIAAVVCIGFAGVALNALPYLKQVAPIFIGIGLLSGFVNAMMQVSTRRLAVQGEPGLRGVFWMHTITALVAFLVCAVDHTWDITWPELVSCFCVAALSCVAQLTIAAAYSRGSALPVNALSFLTLPLTLVLAVVFLREHVTVLVLVGMAITLPASFALVWLEQQRLKAAHIHEAPLTVEELREEHAQVQNALLGHVGPLEKQQ